MIIYIFLLIIIGIVSYILFAPIYLEIDSSKDLYRIRFHHLVSIAVGKSEDRLLLELKILYWRQAIDVFAANPKKTQRVSVKARMKTSKTKKKSIEWKKLRNLLLSFRIITCRISVDTGNLQLNALLYPVLYWIQLISKRNISINFMGHNEIILTIQNNLARMSWAYLSSNTNIKTKIT